MTARLRISAVLAVVGLVTILLAPAADAVGAPTSAWWSRVATTTPTDELPATLPVAPATPETIPAGASVPEGQLLVEGTSEGATAVAAIRWVLDAGESGASLTLTVGPGSTLNSSSIVLACKAAAPWAKPQAAPGTWDTKPLVDGARCVDGVIADDLGSIAFGLQPLASGSDLDVVFTPGKDPAREVPAGVPEPPVDASRSTFRWMFDAPSGDALAVVADSGFSEGEGDRFIAPDPEPTPGFNAVDAPAESASFDSEETASPSFDPGIEASPVAAPALDPQDLAPSVPDVRRSLPAAASSDPVNRTIGFVLLLLSALMAAWSYFTSEGETAGTIGLGRFARAEPATVPVVAAGGPVEPAVGGLSRFARPRSGPPTPLS